jgi:salicylate hydroxylase
MTPRRLHDPRPFLIAGGGIGGLSAAVALAERGIAVRVLEAEQEFSESGAGSQLGPNGSRILRSWGREPAVGQSAAQPGSILIRDGLSGRTLASVPLGEAVRSRYGAPYYATERRLLHRALLEKASQHAAIEISSGFRLASFRHLQNGIAVISGDGVEVAGWALIGADGVHSTVRMLLFGRSASFSGRNAWRATLAEGHAAAESGAAVNLWLGRNAHLVHYRCGPQGPLNAVAITGGAPASCLEHDPQKWIPVLRQRSCLNKELEPHSDAIGMEKALAGGEVDDRPLNAAFADWAAEPRRILSNFEGWTLWPLHDLPLLNRWSEGPVTLLGDAAHALMPFLGAGAVMAIEDAAALAAEVARAPEDPQSAFQAYEKRRIPRIRRVVRSSARMGRIYHMGGPLRLARNLALAAYPANRLLSRNDWLYGYCAVD